MPNYPKEFQDRLDADIAQAVDHFKEHLCGDVSEPTTAEIIAESARRSQRASQVDTAPFVSGQLVSTKNPKSLEVGWPSPGPARPENWGK